jgi:hypothetical protein
MHSNKDANRFFAALLIIVGLGMTTVAAVDLVNSDGTLPDPVLTPGDTREISIDVLCDPNTRTAEYRKGLKDSVKEMAYTLYHLATHNSLWCLGGGCEVDHLISIELAGSNDIKNLWPQKYIGLCNARDKDKLENRLHKMVCHDKTLTLQDAQTKIRTNWVQTYKEVFGKECSDK